MKSQSLVDLAMGAAEQMLSNTHTITIGKIVKVEDKTIDVQCVFKYKINNEEINYPIFAKVPPIFLQGGGSSISFPLAIGDYCLMMITERCFDSWYYGNDNALPLEYRMHDLSDGFALVGINPFASALSIPSVITQLGDTYQDGAYEHLGNREQTGDYTLTGDFTINGETIKNGNLTVNGNLTIVGASGGSTVNASNCTVNLTGGDIVADGISLKSHTHTSSTAGTETSTPN